LPAKFNLLVEDVEDIESLNRGVFLKELFNQRLGVLNASPFLIDHPAPECESSADASDAER
jgi:hypothetical protein